MPAGVGGGWAGGPAYPQGVGVYAPPPGRRPTPEFGLPRPVAVSTVPGTPFGLAMVGVAPTVSGPGVASLVAGVASIMVSFVAGCFGQTGAQGGWGPLVAGAFAVLAAAVGFAAVVLGTVALRRLRQATPGSITGRGPALSGIICGAVGLVLTATAMALAVLAVQ